MLVRKIAIALVATAALGLAAIPSDASAQSRYHSGWHGGGHSNWHGGWHGGGRYGGWRGGWYAGGWRGYPYAAVAAPYYSPCYRGVHVDTPWGPRWRRVWVCS